MAVSAGGTFLLRIEDIDQSRARPEWEAQIFDDLAWLGLTWPEPVMRQSDRLKIYRDSLNSLWTRNAIYACTCNRRDILEAAGAPQEGAHPVTGPDGVVYPGTCRAAAAHVAGAPLPDQALRLRMEEATGDNLASSFRFTETGAGPDGETGNIRFGKEIRSSIGDIVLARRDMGTSYHLSVVLDDAAQGITHVVRGNDLFEATKIHVVLQRLLGLPTPVYHHHHLIRDAAGRRLAKRDDDRALCKFRAEGASPADIRHMVGLGA